MVDPPPMADLRDSRHLARSAGSGLVVGFRCQDTHVEAKMRLMHSPWQHGAEYQDQDHWFLLRLAFPGRQGVLPLFEVSYSSRFPCINAHWYSARRVASQDLSDIHLNSLTF